MLCLTTVWRTVHVGPLVVKARPAVGWPGTDVARVPPFGEAVVRTHVGPCPALAYCGVGRRARGAATACARREPSQPGAATLRAQAAQATATVSEVIEGEARSARRDIVCARRARRWWLLSCRWHSCSWPCDGDAPWSLSARCSRFALVIGSARCRGVHLQPGCAGVAQPRGCARLRAATADDLLGATLEHRAAARAGVEDRSRSRRLLRRPALDRAGWRAARHLPRLARERPAHGSGRGGARRSLARSYEASLVIDTGDLGIAGSAEEARTAPIARRDLDPSRVRAGQPRLRGHHGALQQLPNVTRRRVPRTVDGRGLARSSPFPIRRERRLGIEPDRDGRGKCDAGRAVATSRRETQRAERRPTSSPLTIRLPNDRSSASRR